jgi:hypothetical protein
MHTTIIVLTYSLSTTKGVSTPSEQQNPRYDTRITEFTHIHSLLLIHTLHWWPGTDPVWSKKNSLQKLEFFCLLKTKSHIRHTNKDLRMQRFTQTYKPLTTNIRNASWWWKAKAKETTTHHTRWGKKGIYEKMWNRFFVATEATHFAPFPFIFNQNVLSLDNPFAKILYKEIFSMIFSLQMIFLRNWQPRSTKDAYIDCTKNWLEVCKL